MLIVIVVGYVMASVVTMCFLQACYIREYGENGRIELQRFDYRVNLALHFALRKD